MLPHARLHALLDGAVRLRTSHGSRTLRLRTSVSVGGGAKILNKDDISGLYTLALRKLLLYTPILYTLVLGAVAPHACIARYRAMIRQTAKAFRKIINSDDYLCSGPACSYPPRTYYRSASSDTTGSQCARSPSMPRRSGPKSGPSPEPQARASSSRQSCGYTS